MADRLCEKFNSTDFGKLIHMSADIGTNTSEVKNANWLDLPDGVTENILNRLGIIEILERAQYVCKVWYKICKNPAFWSVIYMKDIDGLSWKRKYLTKMCMHAIDRSQGQLVDIKIEHIGRDELLKCLTESKRSSKLRRLQIAWGRNFEDDSWSDLFQKSPLLEEISLAFTCISKMTVSNAAQYCPKLKSFKYHQRNYKMFNCPPDIIDAENDFVMAIAKGMPQLRHLELVGSDMTNAGVQAILDGCPHLVSLDLRRCFHTNLDGRCGKLCLEHIKDLRLPEDSIEDHEYSHISMCCEDNECCFDTDEWFAWM